MILPVCAIPDASKRSPSGDTGYLQYVQKIGCLGPVLLRCHSGDISGSAVLLGRCLSSSASCMIGGLGVDDDEIAKFLLDQGALVAFLTEAGVMKMKRRLPSESKYWALFLESAWEYWRPIGLKWRRFNL